MNTHQQEFHDYIINISNARTKGQVLLDSAAGTGKSFTISKIVRKICEYKILAPTHKAVNILQRDGLCAETVHKFLKWTQEPDVDGILHTKFNYSLDKLKDTLPPVVFVDECSMLSSNIVDQLVILSKYCCMVYVGDIQQLMPVKEKKSKVFSLTFLRKFSFEENMRIKNGIPEVAKMIKDFRDGVLQGALPRLKFKTNKHCKSLMDFSNENIKKQFQELGDAVCITYSNKDVNAKNEMIRRVLFQDEYGVNIPKYCNGETLLFSGYYKGVNHTYYSNEIVRIDNVSTETIFMDYRIVKRTKGQNITFYKLETSYGDIFYKPKTSEDKAKFIKVRQNYYDACMLEQSIKSWKEYYLFVAKHDVDMKHNYAITIYKAQGSGYRCPIVNLNNIYLCCNKNGELLRRALYTAVSRSREDLMILH